MSKRLFQLIIICSIFSLTACTKWWAKDDDDIQGPYKGYTAKQLYKESAKDLKSSQYNTASKKLEALDSLYPFSGYAQDAQRKLMYAYFKDEDYPSTAATAERYIRLYPRSRDVDYAYYMKGLANFQQTRGTFAKFLPMDESWRDPGTQAQAYSDFATLIQRFPQSKYRANSLQRLIYLRNSLAQRELNNGKFYFDRKMYVASANRAASLIKNYPQAPSAQEALVLLEKSNQHMHLKDAAEDANKVYLNTYGSSKKVLG